MRAAVYERYGPPEVVHLREVATPVPKEKEIRIRTHATTISSGDYRGRTLEVPGGFGWMSRLVFGVTRPRQPILGTELAGTVDSVGKKVSRFQIGDPVFAAPGSGCHAEYLCIRQDGKVASKPANLTWEQAAALSFGGVTALHFLRKAKVGRGARVLVNGASGSVGTACVQLSRHFGADVTGVCSGANAGLVESLGAASVIDYTREDFTKTGQIWDVIVDTVGTAPYSRSKRSLAEGGRLLLVSPTLPEMLRAPLITLTSRKRVISGVALARPRELRFLADLAKEGHYTPVIDRRYAFEQIVEAHRYVDTGRKRGSVVVTIRD